MPFDVFICYKRDSAEDFANALKKSLEEFNVHAFLDVKDIPSKFNGPEKWENARNKAVVECKTFVLILTSGFELSKEIKKELSLARQDDSKEFVYFRHKDLEPNVKINLDKGELNIGKQQQTQFDTKNDLVREAHRIIVKSHTLPTARSRNNTLLKERLRFVIKQKKNYLDKNFQKAAKAKLLFDPAVSLPQNTRFVDCICTAIIKDGQTILLMPSSDSDPDIEGVGRTSVMLRLLGLSVSTGKLIGIKFEDLQSLKDIRINTHPPSWCHLLSADMAYLGISNKQLHIAPTIGEYMIFLWDLSRHIYRATEMGYNTGDHRKEPGRRKLLEIFNKIKLDSIGSLFGNLGLYRVNEIILLRRNISGDPSPPTKRELTGNQKIRQLRKALLVPTKHGSQFWHKDQEFSRSVNFIMKNLETTDLPVVSEIAFSGGNTAEIPNYYYDEIAEIIKTGNIPNRQAAHREMVPLKGIDRHNDSLTKGFLDATEVNLLVTSGEKIFREKVFWEELLKVKKPLNLKILLLNPKSKITKMRESEDYKDKPKYFLSHEITENIKILKRMSENLAKNNGIVQITCATYNHPPFFRMTFIGEQRLLVTSYLKDRRTGSETIFYEVTPQQMGALYEGFKNEYREIEAHSRRII